MAIDPMREAAPVEDHVAMGHRLDGLHILQGIAEQRSGQLQLLERRHRHIAHFVLVKRLEELEARQVLVFEEIFGGNGVYRRGEDRRGVGRYLAEKTDVLFENPVIKVERRLEFGESQAEQGISPDGGAHDAVEREAQMCAQCAGLSESEPHLAAQPAVCGLAADVQYIHQHRRRRRILRRMSMDRLNQRCIR